MKFVYKTEQSLHFSFRPSSIVRKLKNALRNILVSIGNPRYVQNSVIKGCYHNIVIHSCHHNSGANIKTA